MNLAQLHEPFITVLTLFTFIPMIVAAVFVILAYYRTGYGRIGKWLSTGFIILVSSLFLGLMFDIDRNPEFRLAAAITRVFGWSFIAYGFILFWIEADRSLP